MKTALPSSVINTVLQPVKPERQEKTAKNSFSQILSDLKATHEEGEARPDVDGSLTHIELAHQDTIDQSKAPEPFTRDDGIAALTIVVPEPRHQHPIPTGTSKYVSEQGKPLHTAATVLSPKETRLTIDSSAQDATRAPSLVTSSATPLPINTQAQRSIETVALPVNALSAQIEKSITNRSQHEALHQEARLLSKNTLLNDTTPKHADASALEINSQRFVNALEAPSVLTQHAESIELSIKSSKNNTPLLSKNITLSDTSNQDADIPSLASSSQRFINALEVPVALTKQAENIGSSIKSSKNNTLALSGNFRLEDTSHTDADIPTLDEKSQHFINTLEASIALTKPVEKLVSYEQKQLTQPIAAPLNSDITNGLSATTLPNSGGIATQNPAVVTQLGVNTPLLNPGWAQAMSHQVLSFLRTNETGTQIAQLRLDPPELGPLKISIAIKDGIASASFVSAHSAVRSVVEQALPLLASQLQESGISLGQTNVGSHDTGEASQFFEHNTKKENGSQDKAPEQATNPLLGQVGSEPVRKQRQGLLNTYA